MKALILALVVAVTCLSPSHAWATSQEADLLVIDGESIALETNPLGPLIQSGSIKLPKPDEMSSSNWRGYVAKWEIRGDRVFLKEVNVRLLPPGAKADAEVVQTDVLPTLFSGKTEVPADWYSGTLVIPLGKVIQYVHMGYGSIRERYAVLHIKNGQVVSRDDLSAEQFQLLRKVKFAEYRKTPEYAARFKEARSDLSAEETEDFLYQFSVEEYMSVEP